VRYFLVSLLNDSEEELQGDKKTGKQRKDQL
jgi:hypothetical protein